MDNGACRLSSGRFLVVDTIPLEPPVKAWLDGVTQGGELIEAVLATHPFHTLYFPPFHKIYPKVAGWVVPDDDDVRDLHGGCRECPAVVGWWCGGCRRRTTAPPGTCASSRTCRGPGPSQTCSTSGR